MLGLIPPSCHTPETFWGPGSGRISSPRPPLSSGTPTRASTRKAPHPPLRQPPPQARRASPSAAPSPPAELGKRGRGGACVRLENVSNPERKFSLLNPFPPGGSCPGVGRTLVRHPPPPTQGLMRITTQYFQQVKRLFFFFFPLHTHRAVKNTAVKAAALAEGRACGPGGATALPPPFTRWWRGARRPRRQSPEPGAVVLPGAPRGYAFPRKAGSRQPREDEGGGSGRAPSAAAPPPPLR